MMMLENINIPYPKLTKIIIEFPLNVVGQYKGLDRLDEIWDDHILPIINRSIIENGILIKKTDLIFAEKKLVYKMILIANPPAANLNGIVKNLTKENFQNGLSIKLVTEGLKIETLYTDKK